MTKRILPKSDPRLAAPHQDEYKECRNLRLSATRYQQLNAEVQDPENNSSKQDILDIALAEYFERRYKV